MKKYACARSWVELVEDLFGRHFRLAIRCGSWRCPICAPLNAARMRRDIRTALDGWMEKNGYEPAKFRYFCKFLTLTVPGREYRATHTAMEAEKELKASWRKLLKRLRRLYGEFELMFVDEVQKDGYPHLHVLLLGKVFAPKTILNVVRDYWEGTLNMGNVDIQVVNDIKGAASYISKYVSKSKTGTHKKGNRVYSFTKGLSEIIKAEKQERSSGFTLLKAGYFNSDGTFGKVFWEIGQALVPLVNADRVLEELMDFFDSKKEAPPPRPPPHRQLSIFSAPLIASA